MTIGVLDDNAALCRVIETMLALAGHQVSAHTSPLTFTRFIQSINIDELECIIVDYRLGGGRTGIEVLAEVRERHPHLPALVISGEPLPQGMLQGLSDVLFCPKPFHLSTLLAALDHLLERSRQRITDQQ